MSSRGRDDDFQEYVRRHRRQLLRSATLLTAGDPHLAEDLVQIALTRMYLAWPRIRDSNVTAYAQRVLVNALIDEKRRPSSRREHNRPQLPDYAVEPAQPFDESDSPLLSALAQLPPRMRATVVLRHVQDLSVEQTAAALNCRAGTVKSQTARGLDRLRDLLSDHSPATTH